jgi:hypothetical protein
VKRWLAIGLVLGLAATARAYELKYVCGFELQNEYESDNSRHVTSANVVNTFDSQCEGAEDWSLILNGYDDGALHLTEYFTGHEWACDTAHENIAGAYVQFNGDDEPTTFTFLRGVDSKNAAHWALKAAAGLLEGTVSIGLYDGTDTAVDCVPGTYLLDTWYLFEVRWQAANDPDGYCHVYVDGVLKRSDASGDYLGGVDAECTIGAVSQVGLTDSPTEVRIGSMYGLYDTSGAGDLLGDYEVVGPFQTCSDDNLVDAGTTLTTGPWSNFGETPYNATNKIGWSSAQWGIKRTDDTDDCSRDGPNGDSRVYGDDTIIGASWVFKCGAGTNAPMYGKYNGSTDTYTTSGTTCNNKSAAQYFVVGAASAYCPNSTGVFVLGDNGTAVLGNYMLDGWAFLLQVKPVCGKTTLVNSALLPNTLVGHRP